MPQILPKTLISQRIQEGWAWELYFNILILLPPLGDVRRTWAARWLKIKNNKAYPHWIARNLQTCKYKPSEDSLKYHESFA